MEGNNISRRAHFSPEEDTKEIQPLKEANGEALPSKTGKSSNKKTTIFENEYLGGMPLDVLRQIDMISFERLKAEGVDLSYEDIARRMDRLVELCENKFKDKGLVANAITSPIHGRELDKLFAILTEEYEMMHGSNADIGGKVDRVLNPFIAREFPETALDGGVILLQAKRYEPSKICQLEGCTFSWADDFDVYSTTHNIPLTINKETAHLVREHQILRKGNGSSITPWLFYHAFMAKSDAGISPEVKRFKRNLYDGLKKAGEGEK
jgi:hypothetical protein